MVWCVIYCFVAIFSKCVNQSEPSLCIFQFHFTSCAEFVAKNRTLNFFVHFHFIQNPWTGAWMRPTHNPLVVVNRFWFESLFVFFFGLFLIEFVESRAKSIFTFFSNWFAKIWKPTWQFFDWFISFCSFCVLRNVWFGLFYYIWEKEQDTLLC